MNFLPNDQPGLKPARARPLAAIPLQRYVLLDGLRGIAAIAVALLHYRWTLAPGGYLAVDLFFALSGFVLTTSYAGSLGKTVTPGAFLRRRLIRLYPLYFAGTLLGAALGARQFRSGFDPAGLATYSGALLPNLAMLPAPHAQVIFPFNPANWSLFYEMLANVLMAFVLVRLNKQRLFAFCVLSAVALAALAFSMADSAPSRAAFGNHAGVLALGVDWPGTPLALARTAFSFSIGMVVAKLAKHRQRRVSHWAMLPLAILAGCLAVRLDFTTRLGFDLVFVMVISPLLLVSATRIHPGPGIGTLCTVLGDMSFALYALHLPLIEVMKIVVRHGGFSEMLPVPLYLALLLGASWLATRHFDEPVRRWLGGRLTGSNTAACP